MRSDTSIPQVHQNQGVCPRAERGLSSANSSPPRAPSMESWIKRRREEIGASLADPGEVRIAVQSKA